MEKIFTQQIQVPSYGNLVKMSSGKIKDLLQTEVVAGKALTYEGNVFQGFTAETYNHSEVKEVYEKLKLIYADARHVVCAYILPGTQEFYDRDCCDDQETAAGRALLTWMKNNKLEARAAFVVRYCGPEKIGTQRFSKYIEVATAAMEKARVQLIGNT